MGVTSDERAEFHVSDDLLAWGRLSRLQSTREPAPNAW